MSLITILLAFNPVRRIVPLRFSTHFVTDKKDSSLRIMSWNVEHFDILEHKTHPEKKQQMIELIKNYSPDVACFQEMVGSDSFSDAINYMPVMMQQMSFNYSHYSYNRKIDFDDKHHFGIVIFSKYPIIKKQMVSFYPYDYNSIFQYADIVKGNDTFRVFNIHLQSLKFSANNLKFIDNPELKNKEDIESSKSIIYKLKIGFLKRKVQAERIHEEIGKSPYPVIVCGDFNDVPNSYACQTIGANLKNAFVEKGSGIGRTFSGISPTLRIDNIFTDKKIKTLQFTKINRRLSDHFPIIADIELKK